MQSKPEESDDEDPNKEKPDEGELNLGVEEVLAVGPEWELPGEGDHLPTEKDPSERTGSSLSSKSMCPEEMDNRKTEREFMLHMAKLKRRIRE
ncbi:hypothetical protein NDU88_007631 [Pleurodeles waltl]|uniref:Uncharacterized protein n=1 Tax=Pleurodeles waltl TaxID=8319 RepID=A0AAV7N401_PLEWA|nr:hypothetical protein NDU88_007631 [Pleurodeles waltl]